MSTRTEVHFSSASSSTKPGESCASDPRQCNSTMEPTCLERWIPHHQLFHLQASHARGIMGRGRVQIFHGILAWYFSVLKDITL